MSEKIHSIVINDDETIATGRANGNTRPYEFEIKHPLSEKGYSVKVKDIYLAKDRKGYEWIAEIKKRDPMIVTEYDYGKITNRSGGYNRTEFSVEEMQEILIDHGYEIIVHNAKVEIEETVSECGGSVRYTGRILYDERPRILAVTPEQKKNLPEWNTSYAAHLLDFSTVFSNLIRSKLASPIDNVSLLKRIEALEEKINLLATRI